MTSLSGLAFLKAKFPHTEKVISMAPQENSAVTLTSVAQEQDDLSNVHITYGAKQSYLHEQHPFNEIKILLDSLKNEKIDHMLFYGIGLGHHINYFQQQFPDVPYSVYEPKLEMVHYFSKHGNIAALDTPKWRDLAIETSPNSSIQFLRQFIDKTPGTISLCILPSYEYLFQQEILRFKQEFEHVLKHKKGNRIVSHKFSQFWMQNSLNNFKEVCQTPNIFQKKKSFENKPVVLVSAGPSLEEEIPYLKQIKKDQSAYIFTAGSALSTLISHGLYPDAACSYDPHPENGKVFSKVMEQQIADIPIIFGSCIGGDILADYPGAKLHMITTQDTIGSYLFPFQRTGYPVIRDASSIAVVTLQLLCLLQCGPIILVGQNFAYRDGYQYAGGIDYINPRKKIDPNQSEYITDVYGGTVATNPSFKSMRDEMSIYIRMFKKQNVINTTKGGAAIAGAPFIELKEVIKHQLVPYTIDVNALKTPEPVYNQDHIPAAIQQLEQEHQNMSQALFDIQRIFLAMNQYIRSNQHQLLIESFSTFDSAFNQWHNNQFSKIFLIPMCRVFYERLYQHVENMRKEQQLILKAEAILNHYGAFFEQVKQKYTQLMPQYQELLQKYQTQPNKKIENETISNIYPHRSLNI
ncbi:DUF115 domain-containing protein [Paenibacillus kyungheensis]|uniref:DUF115 domain-containing protein n=1 Tax=Paenibacillus kyungheensis TaxID=1452732 RepID=A0AAX3M5V5_9BACL|nr:6-hydroxymethylpterin diphosphokinase MptE-like protein [Paenibacillus kyungheensis]WCT56841.1 DUF115 domain-containing protein [Paenibacillus kyungheensis]